MGKGPTRPSNQRTAGSGRRRRRRSLIVKPASWPRYMVEKRLKSGSVAYYWTPPKSFRLRGFTLTSEALGQSYATAIERAASLNLHLNAWHDGLGSARDLDLQPSFGTLDWLIERYYRSRAFEKVSPRSQPDYRRELRLVSDLPLKTGARAGTLRLTQISARAADKLYDRLLTGPRGRRARQANMCISRLVRAWDAVQRLYPETVPAVNPFGGIERVGSKTAKLAATRDEAFALAAALQAQGHPHLAAAALICFEWLQRPENVLAGHLGWTDYKPADRPNEVQIFHHKTGERIWHSLSDEAGPLSPELEATLDALPRLGVPIVLRQRQRGQAKGSAKPYEFRVARAVVRQARRLAGLPSHVTLDACRHGGMTELGDADLTEQQIMALSAHRSPDAARGYVKRTDIQRLAAARKRRAWVEREQTVVAIRNGRSERKIKN
jgi:hypothetical protein